MPLPEPVKIGIIGGGGWLGRAIAGCLLNSGVVSEKHLWLSSRTPREGLFEGANWTSDNQRLTDECDIVILSVRPADFAALHLIHRDRLFISVMAGPCFRDLEVQLGTDRIIRALPNAAAEVAQSYTPWMAGPGCNEDDCAAASAIFSACGRADQVRTEDHIDCLAIISGSGPAFPALLADALREDAIRRGLPPALAKNAVNGMLIGAGRLIEAQDRCPAEVVAEFAAYQGITAAALKVMQDADFGQIMSDAVAAAIRKA